MIKILTGEAKKKQKKYLEQMDMNLRFRSDGWENANTKLSEKIARLFGAEKLK